LTAWEIAAAKEVKNIFTSAMKKIAQILRTPISAHCVQIN
jgi:hypothetical protein